MKTRQAQFAGSWYPAESEKCEMEIKQFLHEFDAPKPVPGEWSGGIVPHAGWYFSGSIACNVIHTLTAGKKTEVVFVFGMHLHERSPGYIMAQGAWETPFGDIQVDEEIAGELAARFDLRIETPDNHAKDNTIELQLPFIKYFFDSAKIVPVGLPPVDASLDIGRHAVDTAERLNRSMKVIGSTDLTHYGPNYGFSPKGTGPEAHDWVRNEIAHAIVHKTPIIPLLVSGAESLPPPPQGCHTVASYRPTPTASSRPAWSQRRTRFSASTREV